MGMGGKNSSDFPFAVQGREAARQWCYIIFSGNFREQCHSPPAKKRRVFDFNDLCDPEDDQQQSCNELAEYVHLNGNGSGMKWE